MNKIEKKDILPELNDELANLKKEVLKQSLQSAKSEERPQINGRYKEIKKVDTSDELAQRENAEKDLESKLNASELESMTANESSEERHEKAPVTKTVSIAHKGQNIVRSDLYLPADASVAANNNRIKDANAPLKTMLGATGVAGRVFKKVFRFSESDMIPENMA